VANDKLLKAYLFWPPGTIFITKGVDARRRKKVNATIEFTSSLVKLVKARQRHYRRKFAAIRAFSGCHGSHDLRVSPAKPRFRWLRST
jgi:hypothetical protein